MARRIEEDSIPKGRFFKKDDPVLRNVDISDYDLLDVCEIDVAFADNSHANIYHGNLRSAEETTSQIEDNAGIHGDFANEDNTRPVLGPSNFTEDWVRQNEKATRTYGEIEDESAEDDDEVAGNPEQEQSAQDAVGKGSQGSQDEFQPLVQEDPVGGDKDSGIAAANQDAGVSQIADNEEQIGQIKESFHAVSHNQQYDVEPLVAATDNVSEPEGISQSAPPPVDQVANQEAETLDQEELDKLRNEAKADGYDEGLREAQQAVGELTQQLGESIAQVEGLKEQLLSNSRENFKAIAKVMVGSILQKHIGLHPEALDQIITRAIQETIKTDEFAVKVNQQTHATLKEVSRFADKLVVDDSVAPGHFKVESELSVIDGNLEQIISSLLDDADLELFADEAS